jgi:hypothetical protein
LLSLDIQAFSYQDRHDLLPALTTTLNQCGGWVLDRRTLSPTQLEFRIEIQLRVALELYAALVAHGVEFTRTGHESLTSLCAHHKRIRHTAELGQVVALRLELTFLDDVTLHNLLSAGSNVA